MVPVIRSFQAPQPQPVVDGVEEAAALATRVSAAVKGLGAVLVLVGFTTDDQVAKWSTVAGLLVVTFGELWTYVNTRIKLRKAAEVAAAQVTPLASPRDDRGVNLVPVDEAVAIAERLVDASDPPAPPEKVDEGGRHAAPE
jgi:hypothetical protein